MNEQELTTLEQVRCFLDGTKPVAFEIRRKDECQAWIERTLLRIRYRRLSRPDNGLVYRYLLKVSGYSRAQMTRRITQYQAHGRIRCRQRTPNGLPTRYTKQDIRLLAEIDARSMAP